MSLTFKNLISMFDSFYDFKLVVMIALHRRNQQIITVVPAYNIKSRKEQEYASYL